MKSKLSQLELKDKSVFLRADLNVPLVNDKIENDFRIKALLPTLNLLIEKKAKIILATHIDRPNGYDKNLSTKLLIPWFIKNKYKIIFAPTICAAKDLVKSIKPGEIVLVENLRFFAGELTDDTSFAKELYNLAEFYVNDAFAVLHRKDTSITLLPKLYEPAKKTIGLLVEKELKILHHLETNPDKPFLLILGGGKVRDKLPLLENLINYVSIIALCPAVAFTFAKALGYSVGKSMVENSLLEPSKLIFEKAKNKNIKILLPIDYQTSKSETFEGPYTYVSAEKFPDNEIGISIGPKTLDLYIKTINQSKTIFLNGAMGFEDKPETFESMKKLLQAIAHSKAYSVIGGGESVAAVFYYGLENDINFCSTGGGATLSYLSHKTLPGLKYM